MIFRRRSSSLNVPRKLSCSTILNTNTSVSSLCSSIEMWQPLGFLLTIMAFSSAALAEDSNPCVTSLSYIQVVERYRKASDFQTYELCPNRTFQSTSTNPLQITKSNLHLTCKGCVIANSQVEILGNTGADITNVILEGISFLSSNVVVRARGSVAIVDCRFEQESSLTTQSLSWISNDSSPPLTVRISTSLFLVSIWQACNVFHFG